MSTPEKRILKVIGGLLKEGRGFDFQSHGEKNGSNFYNFALYSPVGTPVSHQKTIYKHCYTLEELADTVERILNETSVREFPKTDWPMSGKDGPFEKNIEEKEEKEAMEDLL